MNGINITKIDQNGIKYLNLVAKDLLFLKRYFKKFHENSRKFHDPNQSRESNVSLNVWLKNFVNREIKPREKVVSNVNFSWQTFPDSALVLRLPLRLRNEGKLCMKYIVHFFIKYHNFSDNLGRLRMKQIFLHTNSTNLTKLWLKWHFLYFLENSGLVS